MNRRELFAAAGALAASPLLPAAPGPGRVLPRMTFSVRLAGQATVVTSELIEGMIRERIEHWRELGLLEPQALRFDVAGTVSV